MHSAHIDAASEILTMSTGPLRNSGIDVISVTAHSKNTALCSRTHAHARCAPRAV